MQSVEHEFVFAQPLDWQFVHVFQAFLYVVGVERCERSYHLEVFLSEGQDVGIRLHVHAEVAEECTHADAAFAACLNLEFVVAFNDARLWKELLQTGSHANGAASGATSAVRGRESLVKVYVHHVKSHVARPANAEHGVEVRSVIVHQRAAVVHHFGNFRYARLEQSEGVRVGHHHRCDGVIKQFTQVFYVNGAVGGAFHLNDFKSADCRRGRVCAVGGVGHDYLRALHVAPALVVCADNHQSCKLAMCSGKRV